MALKDVLKSLRKQKGLTQDQLAAEMGLSKSTISMYENGNRKPDYEVLEAFADIFNVDMNTLLDSTSSSQKLTPRDERDIAKTLASLKETLENEEGLCSTATRCPTKPRSPSLLPWSWDCRPPS